VTARRLTPHATATAGNVHPARRNRFNSACTVARLMLSGSRLAAARKEVNCLALESGRCYNRGGHGGTAELEAARAMGA